MVDGRLCLRCLYDCGATSRGIDVSGKGKVVQFINLLVRRNVRRKVA